MLTDSVTVKHFINKGQTAFGHSQTIRAGNTIPLKIYLKQRNMFYFMTFYALYKVVGEDGCGAVGGGSCLEPGIAGLGGENIKNPIAKAF